MSLFASHGSSAPALTVTLVILPLSSSFKVDTTASSLASLYINLRVRLHFVYGFI